MINVQYYNLPCPMYKQADLFDKGVFSVGRLLRRGAKGISTAAGNLIQGIVDTTLKYPKLIGIPAATTAISLAAGTRNSPAANISWVDPRKREYELRPGMLFHRLHKINRPYAM